MLSEPETQTETQPKQARSKARRQALLDHGVQVFNAHGLDDVSIQEITKGLGYSTGSFYSYFADKTEYFIAVQDSVAAQQDTLAREMFAKERIEALDLSNRLRLCVEFATRYFREHTGLVHAALSYERRIPAGWQPNRKTTAMIVAHATKGLAAREQRKLEIAIQLAFGLLVNALLHDPGPLHLQDKNLTNRLMEALDPYLTK